MTTRVLYCVQVDASTGEETLRWESYGQLGHGAYLSYTGCISAFSEDGFEGALGEALNLRAKLHGPEREEAPGPTP